MNFDQSVLNINRYETNDIIQKSHTNINIKQVTYTFMYNV